MTEFRIGQVVRYRDREWVVLPSDQPELLKLRPIGGSDAEVCAVHRELQKKLVTTFPFEQIEPAEFPPPRPDHVLDREAVRLVIAATRLLLRDGAAPFRSLARISVRPRPYQFVPLIMALRMDPVRLLIADDVGVGKTIEALLIAREFYDRGEIRRIAVFCPPYLCDQWEKEMREKFHFQPVVIRTSTLPRLERRCPPDTSVFRYYTVFIASLDLVKQERYKANLIEHCPEFVIVDEIHGCALPPGRDSKQHQRHELISRIAEKPDRHLVLLTATPHSGIEEAFRSILGFLRPEFAQYDLDNLTKDQLDRLANHFVQRRRADVRDWLQTHTAFPRRENIEVTYQFSESYRNLFRSVFRFATEIVESAETLSRGRRRFRYWAALSLLRAVSSSPMAAVMALQHRIGDGKESAEALEDEASIDVTVRPEVMDEIDAEASPDHAPASAVEALYHVQDWKESEKRKLREFIRAAEAIAGNWKKEDAKAKRIVEIVESFLDDGFHPIIWCRFIPTVHYVGQILKETLGGRNPDLQILEITGEYSDEERRQFLEQLDLDRPRVLVSTDCLSEGINLQDFFNAVIHYDLPWNPNRLEQREGRVDRFGQPHEVVRACLLYGQDNPVDGAVLEVLLRKARKIHKDLGVVVPLPESSEGIMEAIFRSLFSEIWRIARDRPLIDPFEVLDMVTRDRIQKVHAAWDRSVDRERHNRTRFAQRRLNPQRVAEFMERTDRILGRPEEVIAFLHGLGQRLGFSFTRVRVPPPYTGEVYQIHKSELPEPVRLRLGDLPDTIYVSTEPILPHRVQFVGRSHPLVESLAEYVMSQALTARSDGRPLSRCGVIRTRAVSKWTQLFIVRFRYEMMQPASGRSQIAEEVVTLGVEGLDTPFQMLDPDRARQLLDAARPDDVVDDSEKRDAVREALRVWESLKQNLITECMRQRVTELENEYRDLRRTAKLEHVRVRPVPPPDLMALLVLIPVKTVRS